MKNKVNNMIIGIHGKLGSGKNALANMIIANDPSYVEKAFAEKLKLIVSILTNQPIENMYTQEGKNVYIPEFDTTVGEMLQVIGTEVMRINYDDLVWVKSVFAGYKVVDNIVITDVRFINETKAVLDRGGVLVKIVGDPVGVRANSTRDHSHPSETALDDWTVWDYIVDNSGTLEDLNEHAKNILAIVKHKTVTHLKGIPML